MYGNPWVKHATELFFGKLPACLCENDLVHRFVLKDLVFGP